MKSSTAARRGLGAGALGGALILLVAFCGLVYYRSFVRPSSGDPNPRNADMDWVSQKAVETQGDLARLKPEDRARLDAVSAGHPSEALAMKWQAYQAGQTRKAEAANAGR